MLRWLPLLAALLGAGCALPPAAIPAASGHLAYDDPSSWVCRGDLPTDACRRDMDATIVGPGGERAAAPFRAVDAGDVDCFYVYPTVDLGLRAGSHEDFADTSPMSEVARAQVGRFAEVCRVFAPLYRQVTIGTYFVPLAQREPRLARAFDDVLAAFDWYLAHASQGRRLVLIGHSQGADMVVRLLRARFSDDAALRARLLVAMPIGTDLETDALPNLPLCATDDQPACLVTYRSYRAGRPARPWNPVPPGRTAACVNPADVAGNARRTLGGSVFPTHSRFRDVMPGATLATTPFVILPGAYSARCEPGEGGFRYLAIEPIGDGPVNLDGVFWRTRLGLHVLDLQLAQGELVDLVRRRAERR